MEKIIVLQVLVGGEKNISCNVEIRGKVHKLETHYRETCTMLQAVKIVY